MPLVDRGRYRILSEPAPNHSNDPITAASRHSLCF